MQIGLCVCPRKISLMVLIVLLLVSTGLSQVSGADTPPAAEGANEEVIELGDALASVNGVLITQATFDRHLGRRSLYSQAADSGTLALDVLNSLIEEEVIRQYAVDQEIEVSELVVDAEISLLKENLRRRTWEAWLAENLYSEEELRAAIRQQFILEAAREEVTAHLADEVEHIHARHILLATEAEAQRVLQGLAAGESFGALAASLSLDVSTRDYGGDLGWFIRGELIDQGLSDVAYSMSVGQVSGPVATRLGYHILQALGRGSRRIEAGRMPYLSENIFNLWLAEAVDAAKIVLNLEMLAEIADPSY